MPQQVRMLQNKHYLGDEFYPPIIDEETFEKARVEKQRRAEKLGRIWEPKDEPKTDYPVKFKAKLWCKNMKIHTSRRNMLTV